LSPYSHRDVIAGAGTIGLEILEDDPQIDTIVAAVGGGGLISGLAIATAGRAEVIGVETEASTPFTRGLAAGRIVTVDVAPSLADGLVGNLDPQTITFDLVRRHVARIVTVTEADPGLAAALPLIDDLVAAGKISRPVGVLLKAQVIAAQVLIGRGNEPGARILIRSVLAQIDLLVKLRVVKAADVAPLRAVLTVPGGESGERGG
jgi:threonine dehydratase